MKTIALTGATSMIGVALIKECLKQNIRVIAFTRLKSKNIDRIPKSEFITLVDCDLDSLSSIEVSNFSSNESIDVFYHIGWAYTDKEGRNSSELQLKNVQYTLDAVKLAKKLKCKKFIGTGSQAEYGIQNTKLTQSTTCNPIIPYGIAKYSAGKLAFIECRKNDIEFNWVRILSIYGTNDNHWALIPQFIEACKSNSNFPLSPCTHIWDYLHEDDAGTALVAIGKNGVNGKTYCLGSGEEHTMKYYIETILELINNQYKPNYGKLPYSENSIQYLVADISELTNDTGWKPEIDFEKGIKKLANE